MQSLSKQQIDTLPTDQMVHRMDQLLTDSRRERNPYYRPEDFHNAYVGQVSETQVYRSISHDSQRKMVWITFNYLTEMEFLSLYAGSFNALLDSPRFQQYGWSSPTNQLWNAALDQATIIASRVAFERFMQLIHFAKTQSALEGKSTFKSFKKALFGDGNDSLWNYMLGYLPKIRLYDKEFRTPEVHSGSKLPRIILQLSEPDNARANSILDLQNVLANLWRPFLEIMNHRRPTSGFGNARDDLSWLSDYVSGEGEKIQRFLERVKDELSHLN